MKVNRSKYNFSKLEVGGILSIDPLDIYSMKNSLRFYNRQHGKKVILNVSETVNEDGKIIVTRTK